MSFRIQPMPGKVVRDPDSSPPGRILEADGIVVQKLSPYWVRRRNEHGVVVFPDPAVPLPDDPTQWVTADGGVAPDLMPETPKRSSEEAAGMRVSALPPVLAFGSAGPGEV